MSTWIQANGTVTVVEPKNGTDFSLEELTAFVGGFLEIVYLPDGRMMVLNEEGKLDDLPFNAAATKLYDPDATLRDYIAGDVLVCQVGQVL